MCVCPSLCVYLYMCVPVWQPLSLTLIHTPQCSHFLKMPWVHHKTDTLKDVNIFWLLSCFQESEPSWLKKKGKQDPCCWQEWSILKNTTIKVYPAQDNTNISLKHHRSIAEAKHTVCTWVFYFENWLYSLCSFLSYSVPSSSALYNLMQSLPNIWVTLLVI